MVEAAAKAAAKAEAVVAAAAEAAAVAAVGIELFGVRAKEAGKAGGEETWKPQPQPQAPRIPRPAGDRVSGCCPAAIAASSAASSSASSGVATTATRGAVAVAVAVAAVAVAVAVGAKAGPRKARHGLQLSCGSGDGSPLWAPARGRSNSS